MRKERDKARSNRDMAVQGAATAGRERVNKATVERDAVHTKVREA